MARRARSSINASATIVIFSSPIMNGKGDLRRPWLQCCDRRRARANSTSTQVRESEDGHKRSRGKNGGDQGEGTADTTSLGDDHALAIEFSLSACQSIL